MRRRGAVILAVLTALAPACGTGGSGGAPAAPPGLTKLLPVDTTIHDFEIDTSQPPGTVKTQLQDALTTGGIIVLKSSGPVTLDLGATLTFSSAKPTVLDGKDLVTLSGGGTRRI